MTFTDEKLLRKHISELMMEQDIDFVVYFVISHWHAIGVDALVYSISRSESKKPSGVIVIINHPKDGFVISEADFVCPSFATVRFFFLDPTARKQRSLVSRVVELLKRDLNILRGIAVGIKDRRKGDGSHRKKVRIVSLVHPCVDFLQVFGNEHLANKYYPMFSLTDEGVGAYMSSIRWKLQAKLDSPGERTEKSGVIEFEKRMVAGLPGVPFRLLAIVARKFLETENLSLFHEEQGKLILNESVINSYKSVIEKRAEMHEKTRKLRPLAIVLTQPFSEYEQVSLTAELNLVENVTDMLVQMDFDVLVKPHPRERADKYGPILAKFESERVRLSHHKMPVETLFPSLDPDCVIGYTSTALVIAKTLYDIPAITITDILITRADSEYLRVTATEFKKLTQDISYNADTFEKLGQALTSVKPGNARV